MQLCVFEHLLFFSWNNLLFTAQILSLQVCAIQFSWHRIASWLHDTCTWLQSHVLIACFIGMKYFIFRIELISAMCTFLYKCLHVWIQCMNSTVSNPWHVPTECKGRHISSYFLCYKRNDNAQRCSNLLSFCIFKLSGKVTWHLSTNAQVKNRV
jgi:hypothetical protein